MAVVSIVIVNYNTKELLRNCLHSIRNQLLHVSYEIIVVDNLSIDGSQDMVKKEYPSVMLIENTNNTGFGAANNIAIRQSASKYILLLNPDTVILNDVCKLFVDFMEKADNNKVVCCGANLLDMHHHSTISYGDFPALRQVIFDQFRLSSLFPIYYKKKIPNLGRRVSVSHPIEVPYVSGAAMFVRRDAFVINGLFDENFFLYFEETDFCYRIRKRGFKCVIIPEAKVVHLERQSSANELQRQKYYKKSEFQFYKKHYGIIAFVCLKTVYFLGTLLRFFLHREYKQIELIKVILKS